MRTFQPLSVFGRKGMEIYIPYKLADGSVVLVEVTPETAEFILKNDREVANADRGERYHTLYHIDTLEYEGDNYADLKTPEGILIQQEEKKRIREAACTGINGGTC